MIAQNSPLKGKLIAFFHQSSDMYGSDKILLYLAEGVQKLGGQPVVVLPDEGPLTRELEARGIEFHTLPILKVTRARFSAKGVFELTREISSALPAYDRIFGNRTVDLVHSNTIAVLGGALWARRQRIPHLWHVHEIIERPWIASRIFPLMLRFFADYVVCNSQATFQWLSSAQASLKKKMRVIWNGVHPPTGIDQNVAAEMQRRFRPDNAQLAIDIMYNKGLRDFSVIFMGSPAPGQENLEGELKQRIASSPMRNQILLQGFSSEIWPAYAALDIVCVPSTEPEPFGLVAVEAMASGKPVVASRFGGLTEIVVDGITGLTFNPRDAQALATALETLLHDDALRARLGRAGKERFDAEFSIRPMIERFASTYTEMMATRK